MILYRNIWIHFHIHLSLFYFPLQHNISAVSKLGKKEQQKFQSLTRVSDSRPIFGFSSFHPCWNFYSKNFRHSFHALFQCYNWNAELNSTLENVNPIYDSFWPVNNNWISLIRRAWNPFRLIPFLSSHTFSLPLSLSLFHSLSLYFTLSLFLSNSFLLSFLSSTETTKPYTFSLIVNNCHPKFICRHLFSFLSSHVLLLLSPHRCVTFLSLSLSLVLWKYKITNSPREQCNLNPAEFLQLDGRKYTQTHIQLSYLLFHDILPSS